MSRQQIRVGVLLIMLGCVRWYLLALGEQFSAHSPPGHGNVVLQDVKRTDMVALMQAQMVRVEMVPDDRGT
jgi:hypothetical protein